MAKSIHMHRFVKFDPFEVDLQIGELRNQGRKVPLQQKPFQLLALLLEKPGELLSREDLQKKLWPLGINVDFDHNLNIIVARLRHVLGDSAEYPSYIETVAKRGYRFIAVAVRRGATQESSAEEQYEADQHRPRLAVLPFESLCPGPDPISLADGLTEGTIARLGCLFSRQLAIVARTSTLKYKGTKKDIGQIGRELSAEFILEGSVRCVGEQVRITAQLIRASDQTHLWAEWYEHHLGDDILNFENETAERIAQSACAQLLPAEEPKRFRPAANKTSHIAYLKGRYYQSKRTEENLQKSIQCFEQAIQDNPNYAPAYSGLAASLAFLGLFGGGPPRDFLPQAKQAALKALELDDRLAESYTALAVVKHLFEWDWLNIERLIFRAMELDPTDAHAHHVYSHFLSSIGRHEEALSEAQKALKLDPLSFSTNVRLGTAHYLARQYKEAIGVFQTVLELEPTFGPALMWLGICYTQNSQYEDAVLALEKAKDFYPANATILAWLGETYARSGIRKRAFQVIKKLENLSKLRYVSAFDFALIYAGLEQAGEAFQWLEKACQERSPFLSLLLAVDPRFDNLRSDSMFEKLLNDVFPSLPKEANVKFFLRRASNQ